MFFIPHQINSSCKRQLIFPVYQMNSLFSFSSHKNYHLRNEILQPPKITSKFAIKKTKHYHWQISQNQTTSVRRKVSDSDRRSSTKAHYLIFCQFPKPRHTMALEYEKDTIIEERATDEREKKKTPANGRARLSIAACDWLILPACHWLPLWRDPPLYGQSGLKLVTNHSRFTASIATQGGVLKLLIQFVPDSLTAGFQLHKRERERERERETLRL